MNKLQLLKSLKKLLTSPLTLNQILKKLSVTQKKSPQARALIKELVYDGHIVKIRGERYGLVDDMNLLMGVIDGHPDRFGFLIPLDKKANHIYLAPKNFDVAMHSDRALIRIDKTKRSGKQEGSIVRIIERGVTRLPGLFNKLRSGGYVTPLDGRITHDIYIDHGESLNAKNSEVVLVRIKDYPDNNRKARGVIEKILGSPGNQQVEFEVILAKHNIRNFFGEKLLKEASSLKPTSENELAHRKDLRLRPVITIDGATAKDFDDAIDISRLDDGQYRLSVHIADVAHYVKPDSELDREAIQRGVSVYFPGHVVPMLPEKLSNGICSLKPTVDRLTLTVAMLFDADGILKSKSINESVIRSVARMTYDQVEDITQRKDPLLLNRYKGLVDQLDTMAELANKLRVERLKNGAIDFDLSDPEIIVNKDGSLKDIVKTKRKFSQQIIEEFMLATNKVVASFIKTKKQPSIFRIHSKPEMTKLENLIKYLATIGSHQFKLDKDKKQLLIRILKYFQGKPNERLISISILQAMSQAEYSTSNIGHFGLGFENYTHFTSPIRRYPDLVVHRLVKNILHNKKVSPDLESQLETIAATSSRLERKAVDAEREAIKLMQTQYMLDHIGKIFDGIISKVTSFGFFVELTKLPIEGLVRLTSITDDYYLFQEEQHALIGQRTKRKFQLGDKVRIKAFDASISKRKIEFHLTHLNGKKQSLLKKRSRIKRKISKKSRRK
ncbi:MAG: ribonuclease R [Nitrospinota bacterium]